MNISNRIAEAAIQYPKSKNEPFAGAKIRLVIKNEIPQADNYKEFNQYMEKSEYRFKKKMETLLYGEV